MKTNKGKDGLKIKEHGPAWKTKVGVHSRVSENSIKHLKETRKWEIKVILN